MFTNTCKFFPFFFLKKRGKVRISFLSEQVWSENCIEMSRLVRMQRNRVLGCFYIVCIECWWSAISSSFLCSLCGQSCDVCGGIGGGMASFIVLNVILRLFPWMHPQHFIWQIQRNCMSEVLMHEFDCQWVIDCQWTSVSESLLRKQHVNTPCRVRLLDCLQHSYGLRDMMSQDRAGAWIAGTLEVELKHVSFLKCVVSLPGRVSRCIAGIICYSAR